MSTVSASQRQSNMECLMNENHNLDDLEDKVSNYLVDAKTDGERLLSVATHKYQHPKLAEDLHKTASELVADMKTTFSTLRESLLAVHSTNANQENKEENPIVPVMMAYKASMLLIKDKMDAALAGMDVVNEGALRAFLLNSLKVEALSGLGGLKDTGFLQKILLKLTFSLASIDVKVPFLDLAPKDVVDSFLVYVDMQRKEGLRVSYCEFYKDPSKYTKVNTLV